MKSYIKIYGPPIYKAIKELEKIAVDMPEVCIMDTIIAQDLPSFRDTDYVSDFFELPLGSITLERCDNIISKSGETLGEHDFFFEWFTGPSMDQLDMLTQKIDEILEPLGCKYTITTK
jgi:hypothetical protein